MLASLGRVAHARRDLDRAEPLFLEALAIRRRLLGPDHLNVAILEGNLARLVVERGDLDTAAVLFGNAFEASYRVKPDGDWVRADLESAYGAYLAARDRFDEAEVCLVDGSRALEEARGPDVLPARDARRRLAEFRAMREVAGRSAGG